MVAVLENIRSVYNVGSIFRTADGAGIEKLYLTGYTPTPKNKLGKPRKKMKKTALGATKTVQWESFDSTKRCLQNLQKENYNIITVEEGTKDAKKYTNTQASQKENLAIVFGNEVEGISDETLELSNKTIFIPMEGKKQSLNVAVSFGIIAYFYKDQYE
ncbi:MAG: TrmH family RNA methyltransferase [Candidatus Magasanikbacteria bacterium]